MEKRAEIEQTKNKAPKRTKWEDIQKKLPYVRALRLKGISEEEVQKVLGICSSTYSKYKKEHPEFKEATEFDRQIADGLVEEALLKLALGYTVKQKKAHKLKKSHYDEREKKVEEEWIEIVEEEQKIPPSLSAQTFWLKNRCPELWNDKDLKKDENEDTQGGIIEIPLAEIVGAINE